MRVKQINIKGLFGVFDHEIPLNMDERITILYGINGIGKTIILSLVNEVLTGKFNLLYRIPYTKLTLEFNNGDVLFVEATRIPYVDSKNYNQEGNHITITADGIKFPIEYGFKLAEDANPISNEHKEIVDTFKIKFIKTERIKYLDSQPKYDPFTGITNQFSNVNVLADTVEKYRKELSDRVNGLINDYAKLNMEIDAKFPKKLLRGKVNRKITLDQLRTKMRNLEDTLLTYASVGLLLALSEPLFLKDEEINEANKKLMTLYTDGLEQKLKIFEDIYENLFVFKRIINQRFDYKQIQTGAYGFVFKTPSDKYLNAGELSSGEQQELILFYELLFRNQENTLILIDEPETSLHIAWQQQFVRDIQEAAKLSKFDVLLATHAPAIVNGRWDLAVELSGPKE